MSRRTCSGPLGLRNILIRCQEKQIASPFLGLWVAGFERTLPRMCFLFHVQDAMRFPLCSFEAGITTRAPSRGSFALLSLWSGSVCVGGGLLLTLSLCTCCIGHPIWNSHNLLLSAKLTFLQAAQCDWSFSCPRAMQRFPPYLG